MPESIDPSVFHDVLEDLVIKSREPGSDVSELFLNEQTGNWEMVLTYETVLKVAGEKLKRETEEFLKDFPERLV
tara:strand:+ start:266 stop:487 length:222 start_codon:yes stop_codon:yes gene_type:complete